MASFSSVATASFSSVVDIQRWGALLRHCDILAQAGLSAFRRQIVDGELPADDLELAFLRGQAQAALEERLTANDLRFFDTGHTSNRSATTSGCPTRSASSTHIA
ncbi:hypothetical protein [Prauserella flavalba]|uniref:hypothetical protein n=1 Tax=Prauserella flavalba TaxID=1477506 RepID=UPI0036E18E75